ncbi:hypothetical protein CDAR_506901 [Caerostris darwini]|uniref:Uncharacterized protein n=1 Tax=Caerostris darwini TaxID=1538125 RepID=A0AAV4P599_9ARAC|nr:hypothetical protein CDAR_506901 [Caerostris darwini]
MIPLPHKVDVCVCLQESNCGERNSTLPKVLLEFPLKVLKFDRVTSQKTREAFQNDAVLGSLGRLISEDLVTSINQILFLYKLPENNMAHNLDMATLCSVMMNRLSTVLNHGKVTDPSFYASCIKVNSKGVFDLVQNPNTIEMNLKVFDIPNKTEIKDLTEIPIIDTNDIEEILESLESDFQNNKPDAELKCHHTILFSKIITKIKHCNGFEHMKTGNLILINLGSCLHFLRDVTNYLRSRRESLRLPNLAQLSIDTDSWDCSLGSILKPFLCNSKISIVLALPDNLRNINDAKRMVEIVSEVQNLVLLPEENEKLILRESLKEYADEIKSLEKDLSCLRNDNGILINKQMYRSLKNKFLLIKEQLKEVSIERKASNDNINNKKDVLKRFEEETKLMNLKIQNEQQRLDVSKAAFDEVENKKQALNLEKVKKVDACVSMKDSLNFNMHFVKNQNSHLTKLKNLHGKSILNVNSLNEDIIKNTSCIISEQAKLKAKIDSLLSQVKEVLLNSTEQQENYLTKANEFHEKLEMLSRWKQSSVQLVFDFKNFIDESLENCISLKNKFNLEFVPLNSTDEKIIEIIVNNKNGTAVMIASCICRTQQSIETSLKFLYDILYLLEVVQTKVKEQIKCLESTIHCHTKERMKFLNCTYSTMMTVHEQFDELLDFSLRMKSDTIDHDQDLKLSVDGEFMKIKDAFASLRNLFDLQQKFLSDKWNQRKANLANVKEVCQISEFIKDDGDPTLLGKLKQQCILSVVELQSVLSDQTGTMNNLCNQLLTTFDEIDHSIRNCSEENKKKVKQQEIDVKYRLKIQDEKVKKCIKNVQFLVEDIMDYFNEGLKKNMNSVLNIADLKTNTDMNNIISELRINLNRYISKCNSLLEQSELDLQPLPEIIKQGIDTAEESLEFNHEDLLSSTPSSHVQRSKCLINEKTKLLDKLKKMATQMNPASQDNSMLDWECKANETVMSLPSTRRGNRVELIGSKSFVHRKTIK